MLRGELDPHTAPLLATRSTTTTDESTRTLVLDVDGLRFIDSSGLRVIIGAHREMTTRRGRLVLRSPTDTTRRLLDITGLTERIDRRVSNATVDRQRRDPRRHPRRCSFLRVARLTVAGVAGDWASTSATSRTCAWRSTSCARS